MARILIVDDAAFMRMMMRNILTDGGHEVVAEGADGAEAVKLYDEHVPDLVTMDITMPNMDGLAALRALRTLHPDARVVMCSAMGQQSMVIESVREGAKDFIVKPFQTERVLTAVASSLR